jgi:hypothetical protein
VPLVAAPPPPARWVAAQPDHGAADYFQKAESDLARSSSQRLGGLGRTTSVIAGNSEVSALREFFAV